MKNKEKIETVEVVEEVEVVKELVKFDASEILIIASGQIEENNLPEIRKNWLEWLNQLDASKMVTDLDFANGDKFVKDCKKIEDKLKELEATVVGGDIKKAMNDIKEMREATAKKRLEFTKEIGISKTNSKNKIIKEQVDIFLKDIKDHNFKLSIDIKQELTNCIKGKSSLEKMKIELIAKRMELCNSQIDFNEARELDFGDILKIFKDSEEVITEIEAIEMVKKYGVEAKYHAKTIIDSRKAAKEKAELERKLAEATAKNEVKAEEPVAESVEVIAEKPEIKTSEKDVVKFKLRFGVTFECQNAEEVVALLAGLGGKSIVFEEV